MQMCPSRIFPLAFSKGKEVYEMKCGLKRSRTIRPIEREYAFILVRKLTSKGILTVDNSGYVPQEVMRFVSSSFLKFPL